jgi:hypothetical protein
VTLTALLLWLIAFMSLVLGAVLALPITVRARGRVDEERLWAEVRAAWGWGLVSADLSPQGHEVRLIGLVLPRRPTRPRPSTSKKTPHRRPKLSQLLEHFPALLPTFRRLLQALHVSWSIEGQAGFDDPADTALAAALVRWATSAFPAPVRIAIEPEYLEPMVRLRSTLQLRVWLGELLFVGLRQFARRDVRRAISALRA